MDRELLLTGIGGKGVQLAAQVIARAALAEGREVQMFGSYGGMMRGGNTDATVVIADGPIEAPPTVTGAWSAIVMHPEFAPATFARLRAGAVVLVNDNIFPTVPEGAIGIPAADLAADAGHPMGASLVMAGAYAAVTGLVALDSLVAAVADALPPYRTQHVRPSQEAIRVGYDKAPAARVEAWVA